MLKKYCLFLGAILFLIALLLYKQGKINNHLVKKFKPIGFLPEKIDKIEILSKSKKTVFEKKKEKWLISSEKGFPAITQELNEFLEKLSALTDLEVVSVNLKKNEVYEVTPDKGTSVRFYKEGNKKEEIIFGKTGPSFTGCYLKIKDKKEVFFTSENLRGFLDTDDFRDLTIFKIDSEKINKLIFKKGENEFSLEEKPSKKWYLNGKEADQVKASSFLTTVSMIIGKEGFLNKKKEDVGLDRPQFSLIINEKNGQSKTLMVGNPVTDEENPDFYLQIKDSSIIYTISSSTFKDLQKNETDFQL